MWDDDRGELAEDLVPATTLLRQLPLQHGEPTRALMGGFIDPLIAVELFERGQQPLDHFAKSCSLRRITGRGTIPVEG